jgi:glycosyltransferase involved in cell wall biosynthesis
MLDMRQGLRRRGHDARLLASSAYDNGSGPADYRCLGTTSRMRTLLQAANPSAYAALRRALAEFHPDVVHVRLFLTQLSPLILPLLRGIPSVHQVVWFRPGCPLGTKVLPDGSECTARPGAVCLRGGCLPFRDWLPHMCQRRLLLRWRDSFDRVIAASPALRDELEADGVEGVEVIPNGVPVRAARPPLGSPPRIAYAGRLVPEKGVDLLLEAFKIVLSRLPQARLIVAGEGPERPRLERLAGELGLGRRVAFRGQRPRAALERELAGAWVQAVPSRWQEGFGNVAAEAMMRGTAVVATASGGLTSLVREGQTGFLVDRGASGALAAALLRVLGDRLFAEELGRRGREHALRQLRQDAHLDRLLAVYSGLVAT